MTAPTAAAMSTTPAAPRTLHQAMMLDAHQLLARLAEHTLLVQALPAPPAGLVLAELALAAAVQHTLQRRQLPMMHGALVAGARMEEVAAASGVRPGACAQAWRRWAERHAEFAERLGGSLRVTRAQIAAVVERHPDIWPGGAP